MSSQYVVSVVIQIASSAMRVYAKRSGLLGDAAHGDRSGVSQTYRQCSVAADTIQAAEISADRLTVSSLLLAVKTIVNSVTRRRLATHQRPAVRLNGTDPGCGGRGEMYERLK